MIFKGLPDLILVKYVTILKHTFSKKIGKTN